MVYTLEQLSADCRAAMDADPGPAGRERVRDFVIINDEILFFLEETASIIIIKTEDLIKKYN